MEGLIIHALEVLLLLQFISGSIFVFTLFTVQVRHPRRGSEQHGGLGGLVPVRPHPKQLDVYFEEPIVRSECRECPP